MDKLAKYGEDFKENKKHVSNVKFYSIKALSLAVVASIGFIVYQQNSETLEAGIVAIGGTCIMFAFLALSDKAVGWSTAKLIGLFIMFWLTVEILSAFGARMSVSNSHSLNQMREIKSDAKAELTRLRSERVSIMNAGYSAGDEAALLAKNSRAISKEKSEAKLIIDSDEQKLHGDIEAMTGVSNIASIRYGVMSALFILGASLFVKMSGGLYCNRSLKKHLEQSSEMLEIMEGCETTKTKNDSGEDGETQGLDDKEPKRKPKSMGNYEAAKNWVEKEFISGGYIGAEYLKKATGTTAPHQQKAIISELIKNKIIEKKGKAVKKYYRTEAKDQALGVMNQTAKLFKFAQVK